MGFTPRAIEHIAIGFIAAFGVHITLFFVCFAVSPRLLDSALAVLCAICAIFFVFESFTLLKFYSKYSVFVLDALLQTNQQEAVEFIQTFFDWQILAVLIATSMLIYGLFNLKQPGFRPRAYKLFLSFCVVCVAIASVNIAKNIKKGGDFTKRIEQNTLARLVLVTSEYLAGSSVLNDAKILTKNFDKHAKLNAAALKWGGARA